MQTERQYQQLVQKFEPGSTLQRIWHMKEGPTGFVTGLALSSSNGESHRVVVRRHGEPDLQNNPDVAAMEFHLLKQLRALGLSVPTPYYLDTTCEILPTPYIVMAYIEGMPEFSPEKGVGYAKQMADQLAKIHRLQERQLHPSILPKQPKNLVERLWGMLNVQAASPDKARIHKILQAGAPVPSLNESVLLHGDFWPGNVLWQDDNLVAVIDWEDAKIGDPLEDFAISRFDIRFIFGIEAMNAFTRHYQSVAPIDFTYLPYWDLYAALRASSDIAEWAEGWAALGRADLTEAAIREAHRWFMDQAYGKLDQLGVA